jgi:lipoprotein NlpI
MGGDENYLIARKHYAQAVELNPTDVRSLLGLYMVRRHEFSPFLPIYSLGFASHIQ